MGGIDDVALRIKFERDINDITINAGQAIAQIQDAVALLNLQFLRIGFLVVFLQPQSGPVGFGDEKLPAELRPNLK